MREPGPRDVMITGVGAVTPFGVGPELIVPNWSAGEVRLEDGEAKVEDFDMSKWLGRKERRRLDRFAQLGLVSGLEAGVQAGWEDGLPCDAGRVGSIMGTGFGGIETSDHAHDVLRDKGWRQVSPLSVPMMMGNAASAVIAMRWKLHGATLHAGAACSAGAAAIGSGMRAIQAGDLDACLAGGAEAPFTKFARAGFRIMGALSPTGRSLPFDARRDGFVMGEGAAVLALEAREVAEARGAMVLGRMLGYGSTSDGYHLTMPEPTGVHAAAAVTRALEDAGVAPEEVAYVNAHGTSTPLNDPAETRALKLALGDEVARAIKVSSLKSAIGHLIGAAGAVETAALLMSLRDRVAPPTLGYEEPDPECDLDYVPDRAQPIEASNGPVIGLSNSFAFGGHNVVLCVAA